MRQTNNLFTQIKVTTYKLIKLNQEQMDKTHVRQNHYQRSQACELIKHSDQGMIQLLPLDHTKGGTPNTGVQWHPLTYQQTTHCISQI
jgi:hypothetical protein